MDDKPRVALGLQGGGAYGAYSQAPRMRAIADINIHLLRAPCKLSGGTVSKFDTRWSALSDLRDLGRATAEDWLSRKRGAIGSESSLVSLVAADGETSVRS